MTRRGFVCPKVWYAQGIPPPDPEINRNVHWCDIAQSFEIVATRDLYDRISGLTDKPDAILVAGWTRKRTWIAWWVARSLGIPVILPSDATLNEPSRPRVPRAMFTLAHAVKNRFFAGFYTTGVLGSQALISMGVHPDRIARGLYPVDVSWWRNRCVALAEESTDLRARTAGQYRVLAVSKMSDRENPLPALEGFRLLVAEVPDAHLTYVGDGPLRSAFEARIAEYGLAGKVSLPGYVAYERLAAFYGAADVFVHIPNWEPWGISVSEALACGVPVVASSTVGSSADLVISGRNGFIVPPLDPPALAHALLRIRSWRADPLYHDTCLKYALTVDVGNASAELERLVASIQQSVEPVPLAHVISWELRNHFGKWSQ